MGLALLVESGADKTVVGLLNLHDDLPRYRERFSTGYDKRLFLENLSKCAVEVLQQAHTYRKGVQVDVLELSSAGDIEHDRGLIHPTNNGNLYYTIDDVRSTLQDRGIQIVDHGLHNDIPPGVKGTLKHLLDEKGDFDFTRIEVKNIHIARDRLWSNNLVFIMPGGGDGVSIAVQGNDRSYIIPEGEGGHLLIGDRGEEKMRTLVDLLLELRNGLPPEYEHGIGGLFLGGVYDWVRSWSKDSNGIQTLNSRIPSLDKAAPIISKGADEGIKAAQETMDIGVQLLVRSGLDYATLIKAGVVAYSGHFFNNSGYARSRFSHHLVNEAHGRIHERPYLDRIQFVLIDDPLINERGLAEFAKERYASSQK